MYHISNSNKTFFAETVKIMIPIALQNFLLSFLNLIDIAMVGKLGENSIAAVGIANQIYFLVFLFLFGVCSGSNIFASQYWGSQDIKNIKRIQGLSLIITLSVGIFFLILSQLMPKMLISIFTKDENVITTGISYLRFVSISFVFTAISYSYSFILRSTRNVRIPLYSSMIGVFLNTVLNYALIFGNLGLPRLEVKGAALATDIARLIEAGYMVSMIYIKKFPSAARLKELLDFNLNYVKHFFKTTLPVIINEIGWSIGVSIYSVVYARISTESIAAITIATTVERLALVIFIGLGNASAVIIGNKIGENNTITAIDYAKKSMFFGFFLSIMVGLLIIILQPVILKNYNVSETVSEYTRKILYVFSFIMWVKVLNMILIVGIFRSGGDTKFSMYIDVGAVWLMGVPMAFVSAFVLRLPVYWVFAFACSEEILKLALGLPRLLSKKWINNITFNQQK